MKNAEHMGDHNDDHSIGTPMMDCTDGSAKMYLGFDVLDAGIGCFRGGFVVERKEDASDALNNEQKGGDSAQAVKPV